MGNRFVLVSSRDVSTDICEDCAMFRYLVVRTYYDTERTNPDGSDVFVETSVLTSCRCRDEVDIYKDGTYDKPMLDLYRMKGLS